MRSSNATSAVTAGCAESSRTTCLASWPTTSEILGTPITIEEARLALARENRRGSWEELVYRANASQERPAEERWRVAKTPSDHATTAMRAADPQALATILDQHPELLTPSVVDREWRRTLPGPCDLLEDRVMARDISQNFLLLADSTSSVS